MNDNEMTLDPLDLAGRPRLYRYVESDIQYKDASGGKMQMSGYVSTKAPDLVNDVVVPQSFDKYLHRYKANPVYCYNHDQSMPIGKVKNVSRDENGLYLDDITLTDTPIVRDYIWPLVKDGVLKQQSIGFLSLDGEWRGKYYHHTEVYLLECSLVTVAANPAAGIDAVKTLPGFEKYKSVNDLVRAHAEGSFRLPSEVSKRFYVGDNPLAKSHADTLEEQKKSAAEEAARRSGETPVTDNNALTPDFTQVKAIQKSSLPAVEYDADGAETPAPKSIHRDYAKVNALTHAAVKSVNGKDTYLFPIGVPTAKGYRVDFEKSALSMCRVLGAKGAALFDANEKSSIVDRICEAYTQVGKALPTYDSVPLNEISIEALSTLKFSDVTFNSGEKDIFEAKNLEDTFTQFDNLMRSYAKKGAVPSEVMPVLKRFSVYFDVFGSVRNEEEAAVAAKLMEVVAQANSVADAAESVGDGAYLSAPDGVEKAEGESRLLTADDLLKFGTQAGKEEQKAREDFEKSKTPEDVEQKGIVLSDDVVSLLKKFRNEK